MLCLNLGRCNGIALRLDRLDHSDHKLQSLQFAQDFCLEPRRQCPAISCAQSFQLLHPIVAQGWVGIDAMDREQSLDPVDVLDTFVNQPATLTMEPTVVLLGDTRHAHNAPNLRFTTQIRHKPSYPASEQETNSTSFFNSLAIRVRIRSHSFKSSLQSQASNV